MKLWLVSIPLAAINFYLLQSTATPYHPVPYLRLIIVFIVFILLLTACLLPFINRAYPKKFISSLSYSAFGIFLAFITGYFIFALSTYIQL